MDGESRYDHQGEPGYIGAVTRMAGMAEAKERAAGESGEQDKVGLMSQDTPTEEAQSPAALAAPVGAAQQPPEVEVRDEMQSHPDPAQQVQAGAPGLMAEETLESPAQTGNAQADAWLGMGKVDEIADSVMEGVMERRRQRQQQDLEAARQILKEHPSWERSPQDQQQSSSGVQGRGMVSEGFPQYQSSRYASQRVEDGPGEWKLNRTPRVRVNVPHSARLNVTRHMLVGDVDARLLKSVKKELVTPAKAGDEGGLLEQQKSGRTRSGHLAWDIPIKHPLLSSTPQGAPGASGDVLGGTTAAAVNRRKAQAFKVSDREGGFLSFAGQDQATGETPGRRSQEISEDAQLELELQQMLQRDREKFLSGKVLKQQQQMRQVSSSQEQEPTAPEKDVGDGVQGEKDRVSGEPVPLLVPPGPALAAGIEADEGDLNLSADEPAQPALDEEESEDDKLKELLEKRDREIAILKETRDAGIQAQQESEAWALEAKQKLKELGMQLHTTKVRHDAVVRDYNEQISLLQEKEEKIGELMKDVKQWKLKCEEKDEQLRKQQVQQEGLVRNNEDQVRLLKEKDVLLDEQDGQLEELKQHMVYWRQRAEETEGMLEATEHAYMLQGKALLRTQQEMARLQATLAEGPGVRPPDYTESEQREAEELRSKWKREPSTPHPQVVTDDTMYHGEPARERNKLGMPVNNPQGGPSHPPPLGSAAAGRGGGYIPPQPEYTSCGQGARRRYAPSAGVTFDQTQVGNDSAVRDLIQEMREERMELREQMQQQRADLQQRVRALEAPVAPAARTQMRFNGKPSSESWTAWWKKFTFANRNGTEEQQAVALWNSLEGPALELVAGSAPTHGIPALGTMVDLLTARYAPVGLKDQVYERLMQRKQKPGEKWCDFSEALTQIYNSASPNEGDSEKKRELLYAAFLAGICDKQMVVQLRIWRSGQGGDTPLLADVTKYLASIAGSAPENCNRFEGEREKEEKETTTEQNRGARGRGNRVAHITEGATSGEAEVLKSMKDALKETKRHIMKEMKEVRGEIEEVKGDIRAVQQTPSTIVAQPTSARSESAPWLSEPREYPSGGYQRYDGYRSGARGRGYSRGRGGRGTARPHSNSYGNERCFSCGGTGHFGRECCGEEVPGVSCYECGGRGHLQYTCPNWQKETRYNASRGRGGRGSYSRGGYRGRGRGGGPITQEASEQQGNQ